MKQSKRERSWYIKTILMAFIGLIFIAGYFYLVMQSPSLQQLIPNENAARESIILKAKSFYRHMSLPANPDRLYRLSVRATIRDSLFLYSQFHKKMTGQYPDLPIAYWRVFWHEKEGSGTRSPQENNVFSITFDFHGKLTGFKARIQNLKFDRVENLSEDDALVEAKFFLESLNISSEEMVISNKDLRQSNKVTTHEFTLKAKIDSNPYLSETYTFEIVGNRITCFRKDVRLNKMALGWQGYNRANMIAGIIMVIVWLTIILVLIVLFIKKLRRDQLEFKWGLRLGIVLALLMIIITLVNSNGSWMEKLMMCGLAGALTIVGLLVLFPVTEAQIRETWAEKLAITDLLFQGRGAVREMGTGILQAYFITGVTLLLLGGMTLLATKLGIGYLNLSHRTIGIFLDLPNAISTICVNIVISVFAGLLILGFWPAFLKSKVRDRKFLFILLLAISFDLGSGAVRFFEPPYLSALLMLPVFLFWAYVVHSRGLFTVILSFIWTNFLIDLTLILVMPGVLNSLQGRLVIIFPLLLFSIGIYLLFRNRSVKDYETYVPEYVGRIAEKERFLKELEIARGVQMRFLPQTVPQSPNLEIVSLCRPAMEVGGDYFDFIQIDDRYMTILIGDVSGKGVSAAFYMTMVKGIIKTLSKKTLEPAKLLAEANEIFYENAPREVFITIIYGIFDLKEKKLTLASAGHNPLIVWKHETRDIEMVNPRGIALGLDSGERYRDIIQEKEIEFDERDIFVFYTDGVSEAMNMENEIFGEQRLINVIKRNAHLSPQQLQEKIVNTVALFSGKAPQHDDFTMVVVKVRPAILKTNKK